MYKRISVIMLAMMLASPATTFAMSYVPKYCPGVESIKKSHYIKAIKDGEEWVVMTKNSKYDTQDEWTTTMMLESPDDIDNGMTEAEAIDKANKNLARVTMAVKPAPEKLFDMYLCYYVDNLEAPQAMVMTMYPAYEAVGAKLRKAKQQISVQKFTS